MPLYAVADFCLIPMGTGSTSVGKYIAECQKVLESMKDQGIKYEMHGYGTNVEGSYDVVMKAIERCHEEVHKLGAPRIATDIRLGTRVDKLGPGQEPLEGSVVEEQQGEDEEWAKGLSQNERKRESVRRIVAQEQEQKSK